MAKSQYLAPTKVDIPFYYVATLSREVTAYDPASSRAVSPVRRLAGPITGLKDSWAVAFDTAGDLFVQNFLGDSTTGVFGPDVNGDTAPLRVFKNEATTRDAYSLGNGDIKPVCTISGPDTLLGETITGLASDPETGEIFALSVNSKLATPTMIHVYAGFAQGNVASSRSFTNQRSNLRNAKGIAFTPRPLQAD
jgi:hypothetical protein